MDSVKSNFNLLLANKKGLTLGMFFLVLLALPLLVVVMQNQQVIRQEALSSAVTLYPTHDTFVDENSPNASYGNNNSLKVNGGSDKIISYLKFDLTALANKSISNAVLRIYVTDKSSVAQKIKNVNNTGWNESITYNNRPAIGTEIASISNTTLNAWKEISLTSAVNSKKGQLFAIAIDAVNSDLLVFKSSEADNNKTQLVVTYTTTPTSTPILPTLTPMPPLPSNTPVLPSNTPIISPTIGVSATPPIGGGCPAIATDTLLLIDNSQSMSGKATSTDTRSKIEAARTGARDFVNTFTPDSGTLLGLVKFGSTENSMVPPVVKQLSSDYAGLKTAIANLQIDSRAGTCMECAIVNASNELTARSRSGVKKAFVFLTDGRALSTIDRPFNTNPGSELSEQAALTAAQSAYNQHKMTIYTIGLGRNVNNTFLQQLASMTGGKYYFPASAENLSAIYHEIAIALSKGSVQGVVYDDSNANGLMDGTEQKLSGWTVKVTTTQGAPVSSSVSDSTGTYTIGDLCNGSYTLSEVLQSGWRQTQPANNANYNITIANGGALDNKNFGNTKSYRCSDTIDNDNNGFRDAADSSCHTDGNPDNPDSYDPAKDGENGGGNTCADSKDNNANNLKDGADPVCHTDGNADNPASYNPNLPEENRPDLIVTNIAPSLEKVNGSFVCTSFGVYVSIKNQGEGAVTEPFTIKANDASFIYSNGLESNTSATVWIKTSANFEATAIADSNNQIAESNETNNLRTQMIPVLTQPAECTITPPPGTSFNLTVFLHGIGNSGDNRNPSSELSNKNPLHPERKAYVDVFNNANQLVASKEAVIKYASVSGNFLGTVNMGNALTSGNYIIKLKTEQHLRNQFSGIQSIVAGETKNLPGITLVSGDTNNDNKLDILDYNTLYGCYTSDLMPTPRNCTPEKKVKADLDDEGNVNLFDLNLFIRELSVQSGL